jgi:ERCC4-type nuclease
MFLLDTRESELIKILNNKTKQLPVGDIWIGINEKEECIEGALIIERKSIKDLEASILDGRYREQRGRILSYCEQNKTQPLYIIEGNWNSNTGRLTKKALMKFVNRLILHYEIPVIQTSSISETAEIISSMVEQWTEDPKNLQRTTELIKATDGIHVKKKDNSLNPSHFAISCLAQCPGVSVKMSETLIDIYKNLKGIMNASMKEIENVKIGNRKIGPVVSKRLYTLLHNEESKEEEKE